MNQQIPLKYLNTNVKAMICGGKPISVSPETKTYIFYIFRIFSLIKNRYKIEILISKEN